MHRSCLLKPKSLSPSLFTLPTAPCLGAHRNLGVLLFILYLVVMLIFLTVVKNGSVVDDSVAGFMRYVCIPAIIETRTDAPIRMFAD